MDGDPRLGRQDRVAPADGQGELGGNQPAPQVSVIDLGKDVQTGVCPGTAVSPHRVNALDSDSMS